MDLSLRVEVGGAVYDVACEADDDVTVDGFLFEVCRQLGYTAEEVYARSERLNRALPSDALLTDSGLLSGDKITIFAGKPAQGQMYGPSVERPVVFEVVAGPHQGLGWTLRHGEYSLGQSPTGNMCVPDVGLSLGHLKVRCDGRGAVYVTAFGETFVDEKPLPLRAEVPVSQGSRIRAGSSEFAVRMTAPVLRGDGDRNGVVLFNRTPYFPTLPEKRRVGKIPPIPTIPEPQPFNWMYMVLPVVMGAVLYMVTRNVLTLTFIAMAPLMFVASTMQGRSSTKRKYQRQRTRWFEVAQEVKEKVAAEKEKDLRALFDAHPTANQLVAWVDGRSTSLWCRDVEDLEFMKIRLGSGPVDMFAEVDIPEKNPLEDVEDDMLAVLTDLESFSRSIEQAPVVASLSGGGVVGFWGQRRLVEQAAGSFVVQAAALHSPEDLVITAILPPGGGGLSWLAWLPHTRSTSSPLRSLPHVVDDPAEGSTLCDALNVLGSERSLARSSTVVGPHVLCVVSEDSGVDWFALSRMLDQVDGNRITVLWLGVSDATLPRHCSTVLALRSDREATCQMAGSQTVIIEPDLAPLDICERTARKTAPLLDTASSSAAAQIPKTVTLSSLLGPLLVDPDQVKARWAAARPATLAAPVGFDAGGPWWLNVLDDGPHVLVAGTSGAGKSELLQTMVASLAAHYPPSRLNFLFVDYKGGAAFGDAVGLPHTVGMVTDLDASLSLRALTSLRAELKRREGLLHGRAKDVTEFERIDPQACPPRLMIVVDEFATLVKEIPDFVAGMVDVAQRGRSLGIHMVLATQRPAGAVSDNILANTNLRVCLRVLDASESSSVIGSSDAAGIPPSMRGRAYVRTGPHDLRAVQTGWANAPWDAQGNKVKVVLSPLLGAAPARSTGPESSNGPKEFKVAVATTVKAGRGLPSPRRPWLEPMGEVVDLGPLVQPGSGVDPARRVVWGMIDDPARQSQYAAAVDLESDGGLLVLGSAGSGKTALLRTLAASVASTTSPRNVVIFGVDYGNRSLDVLTKLPHCGGVAHGDDQERVSAFMAFLGVEIDRRRRLLSSHHVSSFGDLLALGVDEPRVLVLFDNYAGFVSAFERADNGEWLTTMLRLISEGRQAGVHFVITADRRASLPSALVASIASRLVLRMTEPDEFIALGVPPAMVKDVSLPPGRGFFNQELLCQVAVPSGVASSREQIGVFDQLGAHRPGEKSRLTLPNLPERVDADLLGSLGSAPPAGMLPVGLQDITLDVVGVSDRAHTLIVGRVGSGRTTLLRRVVTSALVSGNFDVLAVGDVGRTFVNGPGVLTLDPLQARDAVGMMLMSGGSLFAADGSILFDRGQDVSSGDADVLDNSQSEVSDAPERSVSPRRLLVAFDDGEVIDSLAAQELAVLLRVPKVLVIGVFEPDTILRTYTGWIAEMRRSRSMVLLQPDAETSSQVSGARQKLRPGVVFPPGRGLLCGDESVIFQTALSG